MMPDLQSAAWKTFGGATWEMFAHYRDDQVESVSAVRHRFVLFGIEPVPVDVTADKDGDFIGFLPTTDTGYPTVVVRRDQLHDVEMMFYRQAPGGFSRFTVTRREPSNAQMLAEMFDALGDLPTRFWQCPVPEHRERAGQTVQWVDDVAHCTASGCPLTSANFDYATTEGMA